jgi:hypothetical protein
VSVIDSHFASRQIFNERLFRAGERTAIFRLVIFGLVAPAPLIGLVLSGADWRGRGFLSRLSLWAVAVVIYGAFWFALALTRTDSGRPWAGRK